MNLTWFIYLVIMDFPTGDCKIMRWFSKWQNEKLFVSLNVIPLEFSMSAVL